MFPRPETHDENKGSAPDERCFGHSARSTRAGEEAQQGGGGGRRRGFRSAGRRFRHGPLRLAIEEEGLTDHGLDRIGAERLSDQERRLGRLPGYKPLRKGGNENHRNFL